MFEGQFRMYKEWCKFYNLKPSSADSLRAYMTHIKTLVKIKKEKR